MNDLNQCQFIGNVGNIETRYTPQGDPIVNLSLAVGESWKDKAGQKQERTEWIRAVMFGGLAKIAAEYVQKGTKLFISGKLKTRKWQNQQGQDQYTTEVVLDGFSGQMQMLSSGAQKQNNAPQQQQQSAQAPQQQSSQLDDFEDDIPFS